MGFEFCNKCHELTAACCPRHAAFSVISPPLETKRARIEAVLVQMAVHGVALQDLAEHAGYKFVRRRDG